MHWFKQRLSQTALLAFACAAMLASVAFGGNVSDPMGRIVLGLNHYCAQEDCGKGEIAVVNADGSGLRVLTHDAVTETDPVWSPDGSSIAFLKPHAHGSDQIWVMCADGTKQRVLTHFAIAPEVLGAENLPALSWSPDGQRIVFSGFPRGQSVREQLFILNARTGGVTRLTYRPGDLTNPVWSPDGRWIAFVSSTANDRIFLLSPSTHRVHALRTSKGGTVHGQGLAWAPDSRSLAFNNRGSLVAFDTSTKHFTTLARFGESPSWSPDGQWVVFGDGGYVKEVRADGTGVRAILHVDSSARHYYEPDWGR